MKYCVVEIFVVFHAVPALGFMLSKFELLVFLLNVGARVFCHLFLSEG